MRIQNEKYNAAVTLWKAAWMFAQATLGVGAGVLAVTLPDSADEFEVAWPALLFPLALAIAKAVNNIRKNYWERPNPPIHRYQGGQHP